MSARARSMAGPIWASIRHGPASTTHPPASTVGIDHDLDRGVGHEGLELLGRDDVVGVEPDDEVLALRHERHGPLHGVDAESTGSG